MRVASRGSGVRSAVDWLWLGEEGSRSGCAMLHVVRVGDSPPESLDQLIREVPALEVGHGHPLARREPLRDVIALWCAAS